MKKMANENNEKKEDLVENEKDENIEQKENTKKVNQQKSQNNNKEEFARPVNRSEIIKVVEAKNLEKFQTAEQPKDEQKEETKKGKKKKKQKEDQRNEFQIGDTVKVWVKIIEGQGKKMRERLQGFEGIVIGINGKGISKSFTVRKISYGVGVERVFPYNSPLIGRVEITRKGKVRRAKLYYLRDRIGKAAQVKRKEYRKAGK
jgi:large subunit ribosomal protein L19